MDSQEIIDQRRVANKKNYFILSETNSYIKEENKLYLELVEGKVLLEFLTADIFRVVMGQRNNLDEASTPAIIEHNLSYSDFTVTEEKDELIIITDSLEIRIDQAQFGLRVYDLAGNLINADYQQGALGWQQDEVKAWKSLAEQERFYGLGEKTGFLDKRGKEYEMWNTDTFNPHVTETDPLYQSIPFLIGFKQGQAYGIYFDNSYKSYFDLGKGGKDYYSFSAEGGKLDYYFINGPSLKEVVSAYTDITGQMPLPPKWALGYHQSRYSYNPEEEVKELVQKFRTKDIPCDVIHLDIHYMNQYRVFTWNENEFPNPKEMLTELAESGFKVVNIIDPGVKKDPDYEIYQQGVKNDYFCKYLDGKQFIGSVWPGECAFPDFSQAEVRKWWGDCHQPLLEQGVKGIWNDMNEPAIFRDYLKDPTMDLAIVHNNDGDFASHKKFHNLYGLLEGQATYQGLKRNLDNERPFVLTRAGFAGIQRYAAVWTGDNRSFWEHLHLTMPMLMNMGLSGISFAGSDVGGFAYDSNGELLTRWTQLGTFMPFFRNHSAINTLYQEPWQFGAEYEAVIRKYIKLRYRFLNHLYNLFYQCTKTGLPVMRPLVMEFPEDEQTYNLSDQFMVGDSILVAPVYRPDSRKRLVYLPEGEWYDFWTQKKYQGGQSIIADAPLAKLPIFVKAGSIIALTNAMNYVGEQEIEALELNFYLTKQIENGSYTIYEDDGSSFDYQSGEYNLCEITYHLTDDQLEIKLREKQDDYQPEYDSYRFRLYLAGFEVEEVYVEGEQVDNWSYEAGFLELEVASSITEVKVVY